MDREEELAFIESLQAQPPKESVATAPQENHTQEQRDELEYINLIQAQQSYSQPQATPQPNPDDYWTQPLRAVGSGIASTVAGGLGGIVTEAVGGDGAQFVKSAQKQAYTPTSPEGQKGMMVLGDIVEKGIDLARIPISGLAGIIQTAESLATGPWNKQGFEAAIARGGDTVGAVREEGLGPTRGRQIIEEGGSPVAATIAHILPEAALEVGGVMLGRRAAAATKEAAKDTGKALVETGIFEYQSPTKQRIAQMIEEGSTDIETAPFRLKGPEKPLALPAPDDVPRLPAPEVAPQSKLQKLFGKGKPKLEKDPMAQESIKQGFDAGVIAPVKAATRTAKNKMKMMVNIMEKVKKNRLFGMTNRPSDIAGDSLMERFRFIQKGNKQAGKDIEKAANRLKGKYVKFDSAVDEFINDLGDMGVTFGDDLKPGFRGSDIEGVTGAENVIKKIVSRLSATDIPDAYGLHRMKRYIDELVTYGKNAEGLSGKTERILKNLRRNIDGVLDQNFQEYNRANTVYAETINGLDAFQDVAGKKMDLSGASADKATGTLLRRLMGNAQSRVRLLDAIEEIEGIAKKHGMTIDDDLLTQVLFVDELDSVFGPVARTSLKGEVQDAVKQAARAGAAPSAGLFEAGVNLAGRTAEKARGINEEAAFKAIRELLQN